jgi:hypothetical protein
MNSDISVFLKYTFNKYLREEVGAKKKLRLLVMVSNPLPPQKKTFLKKIKEGVNCVACQIPYRKKKASTREFHLEDHKNRRKHKKIIFKIDVIFSISLVVCFTAKSPPPQELTVCSFEKPSPASFGGAIRENPGYRDFKIFLL